MWAGGDWGELFKAGGYLPTAPSRHHGSQRGPNDRLGDVERYSIDSDEFPIPPPHFGPYQGSGARIHPITPIAQRYFRRIVLRYLLSRL